MAKKKATQPEKTTTNQELLHIFGYGETRLIKDTEKTVKTTSLTKAQALVDFIYSKKPADNNASKEFHVITIAKNLFGRFIPKNSEEKPFSMKYEELDLTLVADLIKEIENLQEES